MALDSDTDQVDADADAVADAQVDQAIDVFLSGADPRVAPADGGSGRRRWLSAAWVLGPFFGLWVWWWLAPGSFPARLGAMTQDDALPIRDWANQANDYLRNEDLLGLFNFKDLTRWVGGLIDYPLSLAEELLIGGDGPFGLGPVPWPTMVGLFAVIGYRLGGWRLAGLGGGTMLYLALFGLWEDAMVTLSVVLVCAPVAATLGGLAGLAAARHRWFEAVLSPVLNVMQSLPHFSYLVIIAIYVGVGDAAGAIATILFAIPPMARLTILGLRGVAPELLEAADMSGCTARQKLWKAQVPAAKPALLVGINQVIMQCFGMTVLASFVGTRGLGLPLLNALNATRIGVALEYGVAIVLMAIALDRLSQAAAQIKPEHRDDGNPFWVDHPSLVAAAVVVAVTLALSFVVGWLSVYPEDWTVSTSGFWDSIVSWVVRTFNQPLEWFKTFMVQDVLFPVRDLFLSLPWVALVVLAAAIGFRLDGLRLAVIAGAMVAFLALSGYWVESMETLYLVTVAVVISMLIGLPVGIWAAKTDRRTAWAQVVLDTFQVLPSFIYLIPVVMLFRVGPVSGLFAILVYSTVPAIRYTMLGLRNVPGEVIEAGATSGCTDGQLLRKVKLPMAFPEIMLGVNQVLMFGLLLVIIAAFIGGIDGLGDEILRARTEPRDAGEGLVAGFCVAAMGLTVDQLVRSYARQRKAQLGLD